ncbi:hypothetical protein VQ045_19160 [Aurantimonas sp. E1-2-R+4]|uniref:hypothetical protein n=1 Tax=Aurantimonas sp. E1-2-R+4 TaxID=3113714 RepID=UPI002F93E505
MLNNAPQDAKSHPIEPITTSPFATSDMARYHVTLPETPAGEDTFNRLFSRFESTICREDRRCRWSYAGDDEKTFSLTFTVPIGLIARLNAMVQAIIQLRTH